MDVAKPEYRFVQKWHAFTYALHISRIALLVLIVGLLLLMSAQGQDILIGLAEGGALASQPFGFVVFYWGLSIWYWSRVLLNIRFPEPPEATYVFNYWRKNLPRFLGTGAFIAVGVAILITLNSAPPEIRTTFWIQFASTLLWGGAFLLFVAKRRQISRYLSGMIDDKADTSGLRKAAAKALDTELFELSDEDERSATTLLESINNFIPWLAWFQIVFHFFLFFGSWFAPVTIGGLFGALTLLLLWGGSWLPIGSFLTWFADRNGWPLLTGLFAAALIFSFWNDNHEIRATETALNPIARPHIDNVFDDWINQHTEATAPVPFVVVATAGGGIRAAYWTATVLGELQDRFDNFDRHLFAVSGVSGGSVGASVFRSLIDHTGKTPQCRNPQTKANLTGARACSQTVLEGDFLAPAVASLLYPDIFQRFLPKPWMPDRAEALEEGWETAYEEVTDSNRFSRRLTQIYAEEKRQWPALLLNATWSENGRRIIASNIHLTKDAFPLAVDQLDALQRDLRLSTAAHNSARFPGVSPPGSWSIDGKKAGHLVDGGYFENYGAEAALTLVQRAQKKIGDRILPVVILISSDPGLPEDLTEVPPNPPIEFSYEIRGILSAFLNTRNARGIESATHLLEWAKANNYPTAHFRMCVKKQGQGETTVVSPPLGWTLSETARETINDYLPPGGEGARCGNEKDYKKIARIFKG